MAQDRTKLEFYLDEANEFIERYRNLRRDQKKMDEVIRLKWDLPPGMPGWARQFRTTIPYDAIKAGVRVLSGLDEDITIDPYAFEENALGNLAGAKKKANDWEVALKWQMDRAARRRAILREDATRSALTYDEIVAPIIHIPTQIKTIKKLGGNPNRQEAALRFGDFAVPIRNPQSVFTRYSDYMMEAALYTPIQRPLQIMDFWNNPELGKLIEDGIAPDKWILFDYVDFHRRVVFCFPGETIDLVSMSKKVDFEGPDGKKRSGDIPVIELFNEPWEFDFLPWAAVVGGTDLVKEPENARFPLLYGMIKSDQWNNTNIIGSLVLSEAIAEAARPDVAKMGVMPDNIEGDYGEVGGAWNVPAGHEIRDMQQKALDPALNEARLSMMSEMSGTAIPRVLVTAEMGQDEPFAGFSMRIQQAMASLAPYKGLAERWFEEAYIRMLYWAKESGTPISAPGIARIEPEDIDKDRIYLSVSLQQDVPIDQQARMATAIQASRELKMPTADVLGYLGETDPERKVKEWMQEQLDMAYFQGVLQQIQMEASGAIEKAIMEGAQQMAQQMVEQMMQQQGGGMGGSEMPPDILQQQQAQAAQSPTPFGAPGIEGVEGEAFNPAGGGAIPAQAAPGATREGQTGLTARGEPTGA